MYKVLRNLSVVVYKILDNFCNIFKDTGQMWDLVSIIVFGMDTSEIFYIY